MSQVIASPSVRARARQRGIDLEALAKELGRESLGMEDIDRKGAPTPAAAAPTPVTSTHTVYWDIDHSQFGPVTEEPMSRFAQVATRNLAAAQSLIPAVTHHDRADMTAIEMFRAQLKSESVTRGIKLTALAFHTKALTQALQEFPRFNASLSADAKTLTLKSYVHIGIAVDTPQGLMVPVLRNVDQKGLWTIAAEIADVASRAQMHKVRGDEMGGASMTITNLGAIGGTAFTPIVNPPEVAILGITRAEMAPVWDGEAFQPVQMAPLDLSYDHRVINGADAARFLSRYIALIIVAPHSTLPHRSR